MIEGIAEADAVVLQARGNEDWVFRLRFPDHDTLSLFHNFIMDHGISIHIDRTYTLTEATERGHRFGLSPEQREALVLALIMSVVTGYRCDRTHSCGRSRNDLQQTL